MPEGHSSGSSPGPGPLLWPHFECNFRKASHLRKRYAIKTKNKKTKKHAMASSQFQKKASLVTSMCCFCFSTSLGSENPRKSFYPGLPAWSSAIHNIMYNVGLLDASDHPFIHLSRLPFIYPSLCLYIILHKFLERCSPNVNGVLNFG